MRNKEKRSKWWDKLCEILEQEFPKNQCKERGQALVLLAYAEMYLQEAEKEKEKLYDWCFKKCGEECEKAIKSEKEKLIEILTEMMATSPSRNWDLEARSTKQQIEDMRNQNENHILEFTDIILEEIKMRNKKGIKGRRNK